MNHCGHGFIADFHDRIVKEADQRFDCLRTADFRHGPTRQRPNRPEIIRTGLDERLQRARIREFG